MAHWDNEAHVNSSDEVNQRSKSYFHFEQNISLKCLKSLVNDFVIYGWIKKHLG
jgi:hypothetical protein